MVFPLMGVPTINQIRAESKNYSGGQPHGETGVVFQQDAVPAPALRLVAAGVAAS